MELSNATIGDMYIDKTKHNQQVNRLLNIFETLYPEFQQQVIDYFEFLSKLQTKINDSFKKINNDNKK